MFESFPVPYSNVDMSQGLSNVFNQVKIFTLSKFYLFRFPKGSRQKKTNATSALTVSKCENFDPFFSIEYDAMILKTHLISL